MSEIVAVQVEGEARVSSRDLAARMGNVHKNVMSLIRDYEVEFSEFGRVAFETRTFETLGGPQSGTVAMLNEEQCYFLLTLVRNTETTVPLKAALVRIFTEVRRQTLSLAPAPALPAAVGMDFLQQFAGHVVVALDQKAELVKTELRTEFREQLGALPITSTQIHDVRKLVRQVVGKRARLGLPTATFPAVYRETWDACQVGNLAAMTRDQLPRVTAYLEAQLSGLGALGSSGLFGGEGQ